MTNDTVLDSMYFARLVKEVRECMRFRPRPVKQRSDLLTTVADTLQLDEHERVWLYRLSLDVAYDAHDSWTLGCIVRSALREARATMSSTRG